MLFRVNYVGVVAPVIVVMAALDDCGGFKLCSFQNVFSFFFGLIEFFKKSILTLKVLEGPRYKTFLYF